MNETVLCKCGCGGITRISKTTEKKHGWIAGKHRDFIIGHGRRMTLAEKLKRPVGASDGQCWFRSEKRKGRYSNTKHAGVSTGLHKASYQFYVGTIPEGLQVCHTCDNGHCYNPDHLFVGTAQDNMTDKVQKGRQPRGEGHGRAVITEAQAIAAFSDPRAVKEIAAEFGVGRHVIDALKRGTSWKHLKLK
jgi:hypothetical protein